jgi:hypothetical protein
MEILKPTVSPDERVSARKEGFVVEIFIDDCNNVQLWFSKPGAGANGNSCWTPLGPLNHAGRVAVGSPKGYWYFALQRLQVGGRRFH